MHRVGSAYADHPRISWFGRGGTVAYVDYTGATTSWFIGSNGMGGFHVLPPTGVASPVVHFGGFDEAVGYALEQAGPGPVACRPGVRL